MIFGLRNGFGMHRKVIGIPERVPEAPGEYWALLGHVEGTHQPTWAGAPPLWQPHPIGWKGEAPPPLTISRRGEEGKKGAPPPFPSPSYQFLAGAHQREGP